MTPTHQGLVCDQWLPNLGGVRLAEQTCPPPGPGEVVVSVQAAALNYPDLLMTHGGYQHKPTMPYVVGMEGAGTVIELGAGVSGVQLGQPVCFGHKEGAVAQQAVVPQTALRPWPKGFDAAEAASYYVCASTAWVSLVVRGQLQPATCCWCTAPVAAPVPPRCNWAGTWGRVSLPPAPRPNAWSRCRRWVPNCC
jgi:NADPH2:quinone reductase